MKRFTLLLAVAAVLATGCTVTKFKSGNWSLERTSILQRVELGKVTIGTNGTASLSGYDNDGGNEAAAAITAAAVSAAVKSMKP